MGEKRRGRQREKKETGEEESISGVDTIAAGTQGGFLQDRPENTHFPCRCTSKNMHKNESKSLSLHFLSRVCLPELTLFRSYQVTWHRAVFLLGRGHSALFVWGPFCFLFRREGCQSRRARPILSRRPISGSDIKSTTASLMTFSYSFFFFLNCQRLAPVLAPQPLDA